MCTHESLLREIIYIFSEGIKADESVCEFIYSFSGCYPDRTFIENVVRDETSEFEAVLDLVFFPDLSMRARIEPFIPAVFTCYDEKKLIKDLNDNMPACTISFPDQDFSIKTDVPARITGRLVQRLNLCMKIPEKTILSVKNLFPDHKNIIFAKIRASFTGKQTMTLIQDFLENHAGILPPQIEDIDTVITVSGINPYETDIYKALEKSLMQWDSSLKKHEDIEKALSSGCIEELMSKGMRIQSVNREDIENRIMCASRIMNSLVYRNLSEYQ